MQAVNNELSDHTADLEVAKSVFETEIKGLQALEGWLGESFVKSLDILSSLSGRIIISGMGKSGHVGRKIAATLASTGSPAFFVHPGEASHGDLGMIAKGDVVMLLSNSGETSELRDIINYCKRFRIPLIAMVRRDTSVLVSSADVALVLPEVPEACDVNAPTTSTTMMIALGDAIAVALLKRKSFGVEEFGIFHPGGKLGASFTKVKDLMHTGKQLPLVEQDTLMSDVLIEMTAKHLGCAGVCEKDGKLLGVITDGDLRRHMSAKITHLKASEVMTSDPITISADSLVSRALAIMEKYSVTSLFVIEHGRAHGIIHIHDVLRAGVA